MRIRFQIEETEIAAIIEQAMPIRIHVSGPDGPQRWVQLEDPREIEIVADEGLVMSCSGRFHFDVGPLPLQDEVRTIRVSLKPFIDHTETGEATLALDLDLDEADLATFPKLIEQGIAKTVNAALKPERTNLRIPFQALGTRFNEVSPRLQPLSALRTSVEGSALAIGERSILFSLDLAVKLEREGGIGEHPAA